MEKDCSVLWLNSNIWISPDKFQVEDNWKFLYLFLSFLNTLSVPVNF